MKHAYLILAHNEFPILEQLLEALDDERNCIFIHLDKKITNMPALKTTKSKLIFLQDRVDVKWADVSVVEAEYKLFEAARAYGHFEYYHLLSGVDMPLKSQDDIHNFFNVHAGKEFIGFSNYDTANEIDRKVNRYHFFPGYFRSTNSWSSQLKKLIRSLVIKSQYLIGYRRNKNINFKKGTQWVSITEPLLELLLQKKQEVLTIYKNSFCSDEIFIHTICWNSDFRYHIYNQNSEPLGSQRMINWNKGILYDWTDRDFEILNTCDLLFARKFNSRNIEVVKKIKEKIINRS